MAFANEWLGLILRWLHVIAGIMWVGDSFLFMWLDSHLEQPQKTREGAVVGELWMVHSGGFYEVVKRKFLLPNEMPAHLHWFKWESYTTWITGFLLLGTVYYHGAKIYLIDAAQPAISSGGAIGLSFSLLVVGWLVYDLLWRSPLAKNPRALALGCYLLMVATAYGLSNLFSGRGLFIQVGAMMGTVMAANVFFRIIPAQKNMLAATRAGTAVDTSLGARAKQRSTHNHFMTLPVVFTMLSNHFPNTYGAQRAWLVVAIFGLLGAGIKHAMNKKSGTNRLVLLGTVASLVTLVFLTLPAKPAASQTDLALHQGPVSFAMAKSIVERRCITCHAAQPTDPSFTQPPAGVVLTSDQSVLKHKERILVRAVQTKTMPLGNLTGMTDEERAQLGAWIVQGAPAVAQPQAPVVPPPAVDAEAIFAQRCAVCHGTSGEGDGMAAANLNPKPRNYTDKSWQASVTDEQLKQIIVQGGEKMGKSLMMPANPDLQDQPQVVDGLVQIIRKFGQ